MKVRLQVCTVCWDAVCVAGQRRCADCGGAGSTRRKRVPKPAPVAVSSAAEPEILCASWQSELGAFDDGLV
jgi:hypothetical protein